MQKKNTYFIDIDGTLFVYRKFDELLTTEPEVVESVANSIRKWYEEGHHIVFTTARPSEYYTHTLKELQKYAIPFNQIVMGIERGPRYLINDMDPEKEGHRAIGINLIRNQGFEGSVVVND